MKANELMIGDWIYNTHNKQDEQVVEVGSNCVMLAYNDLYAFDEIEPIPISTKVLEKNGFVAKKYVYPYPYYEYEFKEIKVKVGFAFPQGSRTSYKEPWVYIDTENVFIEHLPCMFVHQIQNTLRLCKIEKEIEL